MRTIIDRLAYEPAAIGTVLASVLPALVVLGVLSIDAQAIGILVVAVNAVVGFTVRLLVAPSTQPPTGQPEPGPAGG
jgi:hypothetical protein